MWVTLGGSTVVVLSFVIILVVGTFLKKEDRYMSKTDWILWTTTHSSAFSSSERPEHNDNIKRMWASDLVESLVILKSKAYENAHVYP